MPSSAERLRQIRTFPQLVKYLRDDLDWPIEQEKFDDLMFEWDAAELGIDPKNAAKIEEIKQLRPLAPDQPWGIFFIRFAPKHLPIVVLRRLLGQLVIHKRASARKAGQKTWAAKDLLFISAHGEGGDRELTFAHFSDSSSSGDLPTLRVLGWDEENTNRKLDHVASILHARLSWPVNPADVEPWRDHWASAFELRPREVIRTSKELSIRLAELARVIRERIKRALSIETEKGPLTKLMKAFQEALIHDLSADSFSDMYAQTIAYGLLSARIADPHSKTADDFAGHMRTNPLLRELMEAFLKVGGRHGRASGPGIDFDELGVREVVELLDDPNTHMEAVVRDFDDRNPQEDPVIHFYELFLNEYDKRQKVSRGVFYTPRPVVSYIVRSVDELLRSEFGLVEGLADTATWGDMAKRQGLKIPEGVPRDQDFVQILDPATGTGTFLVEVIEVIHKTLVAKWEAEGHDRQKIDALWNEYVPRHLLPRLHGYELLMAPYAIAHLKIGLKLYETGYRFATDERARIYLTNALEPAHDFSGRFEFAIPALAHEAQAVNEIKRRQRFTVVIGNPPYSNYGQMNKNSWILGLLDDYKHDLGEKKINLDDDYIKFFRFAQQCIDSSSRGAIGIITNHTFLDGITHRRMREYLLGSFQRLYLLNAHGSIKKNEQCPDGTPDQNLFDIQQGVSISLLLKTDGKRQTVCLSDLWGTREVKYRWLANRQISSTTWTPLAPSPDRFYFARSILGDNSEYSEFPGLLEVFRDAATGFETARDHFAIAFTAKELRERLAALLSTESDAKIRKNWGLDDKRDWTLAAARKQLRRLKDPYQAVRTCCYRPFDTRFTHYADVIVTWPRMKVLGSIGPDNPALVASRMIKGEQPNHFFVVNEPTEKIFISAKTSNNAFIFPLFQQVGHESPLPGLGTSGRQLNIREEFLRRLYPSSWPRSADEDMALDLFRASYAIFHSPTYRVRYQEFLKIDYPRLPLPRSLQLFRDLARLGGELVALHLMESDTVDDLITTYTGPKNAKVRRIGWSQDTVWLDAGATRKGRPCKPGTIGFRGVPEAVWNFHIGGYQVCEKWLKVRKGRTLSNEEVAHYQKIAAAVAETIRLMKEIDEVIEQQGGWPGAFQGKPSDHELAKPEVRKVAEPIARPYTKHGAE